MSSVRLTEASKVWASKRTVLPTIPARFSGHHRAAGDWDGRRLVQQYWTKHFKHLPTWVFHGAKDKAMPVARTQEMIDALTKHGGYAETGDLSRS